MVELAHLTGDRQNDLKDEKRKAQMSAARQVLERSTMLLLISSKVSETQTHSVAVHTLYLPGPTHLAPRTSARLLN